MNHVLLAPADRAVVLRASAYRQVRGVAMVGLVGGALAGLLVAQRIPNTTSADVAGWIVAGLVDRWRGRASRCGGARSIASGRRLGRLRHRR